MGKYNKDIIQLIYKFVNNRCTDEEWERVLKILDNKEYTKEWEYVMEDRWRNPGVIDGIKRKHYTAKSSEADDESGYFLNSFLKKMNYRVMAVAASVAVLLACGWGFWKYIYLPGQEQEMVVRSDGQVKQVTMKDGSTVWLNKNSQISYGVDFGDSTRRVDLVGHGYFDIARDTTKRFIVHTRNLEIQVLGTSFDVFSYEDSDQEKVTVTSGEVKVNRTNSSDIFVLLQGDELVYESNEFIVHRDTVLSGEENTWRSMALNFEDESLGTIIRQLEHIYDLKIRFADPELASRRITIKPKNADWSSIAAVLELVAGINIEEDTENSRSFKIQADE